MNIEINLKDCIRQPIFSKYNLNLYKLPYQVMDCWYAMQYADDLTNWVFYSIGNIVDNQYKEEFFLNICNNVMDEEIIIIDSDELSIENKMI